MSPTSKTTKDMKGETGEHTASSPSFINVADYTENKLNMDKNKDQFSSDSQMAEDRRLGGVVPASLASSSCEEQAAGLTTSPADLDAIVSNLNSDLNRMESTLREIKNAQESMRTSSKAPRITQQTVLDDKTIMVKKKRLLDNSDAEDEESPVPMMSSTYHTVLASSESILISDTEDEAMDSESSKNRSKKGKKPRGKKRRQNSPSPRKEINRSDEEIETHFTVESKGRIEQEAAGLEIAHATEVFARLQEWLDKVENMQRKSKNIKGSYSGQMKVFLECCKRAGKLL